MPVHLQPGSPVAEERAPAARRPASTTGKAAVAVVQEHVAGPAEAHVLDGVMDPDVLSRPAPRSAAGAGAARRTRPPAGRALGPERAGVVRPGLAVPGELRGQTAHPAVEAVPHAREHVRLVELLRGVLLGDHGVVEAAGDDHPAGPRAEPAPVIGLVVPRTDRARGRKPAQGPSRQLASPHVECAVDEDLEREARPRSELEHPHPAPDAVARVTRRTPATCSRRPTRRSRSERANRSPHRSGISHRPPAATAVPPALAWSYIAAPCPGGRVPAAAPAICRPRCPRRRSRDRRRTSSPWTAHSPG